MELRLYTAVLPSEVAVQLDIKEANQQLYAGKRRRPLLFLVDNDLLLIRLTQAVCGEALCQEERMSKCSRECEATC